MTMTPSIRPKKKPPGRLEIATMWVVGIVSAIAIGAYAISSIQKMNPQPANSPGTNPGMWVGALLIQIPYLVAVAVGLGIYLVPTIVAARSNHPHAPAVILLNILLGWTLVGWVGSLIWIMVATSKPPAPPRI